MKGTSKGGFVVSNSTATWRVRDSGAVVGAVAGTLAFLIAGVVPGLVYGGYLGVMLGASFSGGTLFPGWFASILILACMAIGLACTWFVFLVAGAVMGALVGWAAEGEPEAGHASSN